MNVFKAIKPPYEIEAEKVRKKVAGLQALRTGGEPAAVTKATGARHRRLAKTGRIGKTEISYRASRIVTARLRAFDAKHAANDNTPIRAPQTVPEGVDGYLRDDGALMLAVSPGCYVARRAA